MVAVDSQLRGLPYRLGLTAAPEGGWSDAVGYPPNLDLPSWIDDGDVELFGEAHRAGGFAGLVLDRIADGQAAPSAELLATRRQLLREWSQALARALDDRAQARSRIARSLRQWRAGLRLEARAFAEGRLAPGDYARLVAAKLDWVGVSARALLARRAPWQVASFARAHALFLLSQQCRDDVIDAAEDRALHGASFPELLGVAEGALVRAAPRLALRAAELAAESGCPRLAEWLAAHARDIDVILHRDSAQMDELLGALFARSAASALD